MFLSAPSINLRKAKETRHRTISPPCAGRSRRRECGWYSIKGVQPGSSVKMPARIFLKIPSHRALRRISRTGKYINAQRSQRGDEQSRALCGSWSKPRTRAPWSVRLERELKLAITQRSTRTTTTVFLNKGVLNHRRKWERLHGHRCYHYQKKAFASRDRRLKLPRPDTIDKPWTSATRVKPGVNSFKSRPY